MLMCSYEFLERACELSQFNIYITFTMLLLRRAISVAIAAVALLHTFQRQAGIESAKRSIEALQTRVGGNALTRAVSPGCKRSKT